MERMGRTHTETKTLNTQLGKHKTSDSLGYVYWNWANLNLNHKTLGGNIDCKSDEEMQYYNLSVYLRAGTTLSHRLLNQTKVKSLSGLSIVLQHILVVVV